MNTSAEAIRLLEAAKKSSEEAKAVIDDLIVEHDYQDVASLVSKAATQLLEAATLLMHSEDGQAFEALANADDVMDEVYAIIDAETDDD